ncbi:Pimeloyl-ACP methyl ester carboxylesterase [Micromonospora pattaloongensis]|uniref:Pimeloyl-ACP methyl ester carboxylesterase n=1 Tax=Micromonospora pattaloongensis TaxID=405436 RepID=A0A1H3P3E0_9ACTN|nr:alpha/beta fold hydrolase [Micromonospora pattaloongensis]SDY95578.1 Pimeloyl-ACP methyl ester carboxylesterase [Micromonospora pattaloongensis]
MTGIGAFRSPAARARFHAAYDRAFERLWPMPGEARDVPTSFGTTRVQRCGRVDGEPMVLLHGAGGSCLSWHRHVAALGARHPLVVVDTVGEPGRSVQAGPVRHGRDGARWLAQVLDGVGVSAAHLVGFSYGGWLALQLALHEPARVRTVALVDPAGFAAVRARFYLWLVASGCAALTPPSLRDRAAGWLRNATLRDADLVRLAVAAVAFRRRLPVPRPLTDDELRAVRTPVLALFAQHSAVHDARRVRARAAALLPVVRAEIVPHAGHALLMEHPELVTARILALASTSSPAAGQASHWS